MSWPMGREQMRLRSPSCAYHVLLIRVIRTFDDVHTMNVEFDNLTCIPRCCEARNRPVPALSAISDVPRTLCRPDKPSTFIVTQSHTMRTSTLAVLPALSGLAQASTIHKEEDRPLLVTSTPRTAIEGCLAEAYYGTYGGSSDESIYLPAIDCLAEQQTLSFLESGSIRQIPANIQGGRLVWIGLAGVDGQSELGNAWENIDAMANGDWTIGAREDQKAFAAGGHVPGGVDKVMLIHQTLRSMIVHVPEHVLPILDTLLPAHLVPVALPTRPLPAPMQKASNDLWSSVPSKLVANLANITKHLTFDPKLDGVLNGIDLNDVRKTARWLTGEAPSGITSRHSFTPGAIKAAHWLKGESSLRRAHMTIC